MTHHSFIPPDLINLLTFTTFEVYGLEEPLADLRLHKLNYAVEQEIQRANSLDFLYTSRPVALPATGRFAIQKAFAVHHTVMPSHVPYADPQTTAAWADVELLSLCHALAEVVGRPNLDLLTTSPSQTWVDAALPHLPHLQCLDMSPSSLRLARHFAGPNIVLVGGMGLDEAEFQQALAQLTPLKTDPDAIARHEKELNA